jgi:hypothetical protein
MIVSTHLLTSPLYCIRSCQQPPPPFSVEVKGFWKAATNSRPNAEGRLVIEVCAGCVSLWGGGVNRNPKAAHAHRLVPASARLHDRR